MKSLNYRLKGDAFDEIYSNTLHAHYENILKKCNAIEKLEAQTNEFEGKKNNVKEEEKRVEDRENHLSKIKNKFLQIQTITNNASKNVSNQANVKFSVKSSFSICLLV